MVVRQYDTSKGRVFVTLNGSSFCVEDKKRKVVGNGSYSIEGNHNLVFGVDIKEPYRDVARDAVMTAIAQETGLSEFHFSRDKPKP